MKRLVGRAARATVALVLATASCGSPAPPAPPPPPAIPLRLRPAADLVPAAGLVWLVDIRPRELAAHPELRPALKLVLAPERLDAFAKRHGGVDVRQLDEAVVAAYDRAHVFLGIGTVDPGAVEKAFTARARNVDGRGIDRSKTDDGRDRVAITRLWGDAGGDRQQLVIFGGDGVALEVGRFGVLRAVEAFAQERLKRASPALRAAPLARAVAALGEMPAPIRAFAPGPFTGEWARGLGGLLATTTAAALSVDVVPGPAPSGSARLRLKLVLLDAKSDRPAEAVQRLGAAYDLLAQSDLGRLCGLDRPLMPPHVRYEPAAAMPGGPPGGASGDGGADAGAADAGGGDRGDAGERSDGGERNDGGEPRAGALTLVTDLDALALARGIRAATAARAEEIMSY